MTVSTSVSCPLSSPWIFDNICELSLFVKTTGKPETRLCESRNLLGETGGGEILSISPPPKKNGGVETSFEAVKNACVEELACRFPAACR